MERARPSIHQGVRPAAHRAHRKRLCAATNPEPLLVSPKRPATAQAARMSAILAFRAATAHALTRGPTPPIAEDVGFHVRSRVATEAAIPLATTIAGADATGRASWAGA